MLNKNFNAIIDMTFRDNNVTDKGITVTGKNDGYIATDSFNKLSKASSLNTLSAGNGETGIFLYTEEITESIDTFITPTAAEFTDYSVATTVKSSNTNEVGISYSRTIVPNSDAIIKSIALVSYYTSESCMIGFENLSEPVQLTAGEPHTFTFTIKVA